MSDNFDYRQWMLDNRMGPYSKDPLKKGKLNESIEEEAIEEAPMPPAPEDVYDSSEEDEYDRGWDLAGPQIKSAIDNLRSSGYGDEDIMNFFRTALENYDQAFSGFSTGEDSEEEQGVMESGYPEETNEADRGYHVNRKSPVPGRPGLYQDDEHNYFNSRGEQTDSEGNVIRDKGSYSSKKAQSISPSSIGLSSMPSDLGLNISKLVSMTGQYGPFYVITFTGTGENPKVKWGRISITASERDAERMKSGGEEAIRSFINGKIDSGKYKTIF